MLMIDLVLIRLYVVVGVGSPIVVALDDNALNVGCCLSLRKRGLEASAQRLDRFAAETR